MLLRIIGAVARRISRRLRNNRGKPFADGIEHITDRFHRDLNNVNFNMETNGENRVLQILSGFKFTCIFDVGANIGDWGRAVADLNPGATIHAFELVPSTFAVLSENTKSISRIIKNNYGLSDQSGTVTVNIGNDSGMATVYKIEGVQYHNEYYTKQQTCQVRKASDYISENNIGNIDFVKIDVEGMDLRVIKGFESKIENVKIFQFEYGIFNISSHDLLADFCVYLDKHGFVVGKIFPRTVQFFNYHFDMENFHGSNFIAVKKNETAIINKLAGKN